MERTAVLAFASAIVSVALTAAQVPRADDIVLEHTTVKADDARTRLRPG